MVSAGPGGARVVAAVAGLSWSAVRAGDGGGDPGDVGVVEAAQDAGEVDGDVVVAEAGGDAQDGSFGGRAAELVTVQGGDGVFPVDVGVGMPVVAGAGAMQLVVKSFLVSQVWWAQISSAAAASLVRPAAWEISVAAQDVGGHWSFTSVMAARTAVVSAMVLCVV